MNKKVKKGEIINKKVNKGVEIKITEKLTRESLGKRKAR